MNVLPAVELDASRGPRRHIAGPSSVAGCLLWRSRRAGAVLALGLLPFGIAYWPGFELPYAWPVGIAGTVAVVAAARANGVVR